MCAYWTEIETTEHFFLRCHFYTSQTELSDYLKKVDSIFFNLNEKDQVNNYCMVLKQMILNIYANQEILKFVITYIKTTTRFDRLLISNQLKLFLSFL